MEWEGLYNYFIIAIFIIGIIALAYIFIWKPSIDNNLEQQRFEKEQDYFLMTFCKNLNFQNYKIEPIEGTVYNAICYSDSGQNARVFTYFRYDWELKNGQFKFFVMELKK
jgi:hypothetical protein